MLKRLFRPILVTMLVALGSSTAARADELEGIWLTQAGDAKINITSCGKAVCGYIVWLKTPIDPATGKPQLDDKNPNRALANRPIIGINIFVGMNPVASKKWSGRIYNADDGKTYTSELNLLSLKKLEVRGCVLRILCGSENWTRVREPTPKSGDVNMSALSERLHAQANAVTE